MTFVDNIELERIKLAYYKLRYCNLSDKNRQRENLAYKIREIERIIKLAENFIKQ